MPRDMQPSESHDVAVRLQHRVEPLDFCRVDEHDPRASLRDETELPGAVGAASSAEAGG